MTIAEKDKLWCDYMVTILDLNRIHFKKNPLSITGIEEFHKKRRNFIHRAQKLGTENYESWNWKWGERVFGKVTKK